MSLEELRKKINAIDEKIVSILNERAKISLEIGKNKLENNQSIYAPHREKEVLDRIKEMNQGPMTSESLEAVYREIMSSSLSLEKPLKISYLGTEGSFTHMAANKKFGSQVCYVPCNSILEVFHKVEHGECDYGVVPIENSVEGAVTHTFDILVDSDLKICAQTTLKVEQHLLSKENLKDIKTIYSNPQSFGQCRIWLAENLPEAGQIWVASNTEAAQKAAKQRYSAAIASSLAAKVYDVPIIRSNIQDMEHNMTRFFIIAKQDVPMTGNDKTSIIFSIKDKVGALHDMLVPFRDLNINLTKIESRPSKKKAWDYYFFVDFLGHREDKKVKQALDRLEGLCKYLKIAGSYPATEA
ncbi:MAG TPA: prephenate dehydratase [Candidatus Omnitrophota bacterium]|nr:prephenate dehydratase [Candidatus Omnitrophota bacterium]